MHLVSNLGTSELSLPSSECAFPLLAIGVQATHHYVLYSVMVGTEHKFRLRLKESPWVN